MKTPTPFWIALRDNQDWVDHDVLRAIEWLTSVVEKHDWSNRVANVLQEFESAKSEWAIGNRVRLFDPADTIAWYVFQASAYASQREYWYEPEAFRIAPVFRRFGQILPRLKSVHGIMDRVQHLMTSGRRQPDDELFELLVAGAYKRRWDNVAFVPEQRGIAKTQDLLVTGNKRRWAVECKRVNKSDYSGQELIQAAALAVPVHNLCRLRKRSIVLEVRFKVELSAAPLDYLLERAVAFLDSPALGNWDDTVATGRIRNVDWAMAQAVLEHDDVFFGSSRMVELLTGHHTQTVDYDMAAEWIPSDGRPLHAASMSQASVVGWVSGSYEAAHRKAKHFRALVSSAALQIPDAYPGVVHVGYEARTGNAADAFRHSLNAREMSTFDPKEKELLWVYGNYLLPERTTAQNEALAISETTATYKIGRHRKREPLPDHGLFSENLSRPGGYWDM
jgi:hypothetical protein